VGLNTLALLASADLKAIRTSYITYLSKEPYILSTKSPTFDNSICYVGMNTLVLLAIADRNVICTSHITYLSKEPYILSTLPPYLWQSYSLFRSEYIGSACRCRSQGHQYVKYHMSINRALYSINNRVVYDNDICYLGLNTLGLLASADRTAIRTSHLTHLSKKPFYTVNKAPYIWQSYLLSRSEYIGAACECWSQGHPCVIYHIFIKINLYSVDKRALYLAVIFVISVWSRWGCLRVPTSMTSVRHMSHIPSKRPYILSK